jgi:hypothetical protein
MAANSPQEIKSLVDSANEDNKVYRMPNKFPDQNCLRLKNNRNDEMDGRRYDFYHCCCFESGSETSMQPTLTRPMAEKW